MLSLLAAVRTARSFVAIAAVEDESSRDGMHNRIIEPGALRFDGGPYPLLEGHDPDNVIGRVDRFSWLADEPEEIQLRALLEGGLDNVAFDRVLMAHGSFADTAEACSIVEMVEGRFITGVSVGAGQFTADDDDETLDTRFSDLQVIELSVVPLPALGSSRLWLSDTEYSEPESLTASAGTVSQGIHSGEAFKFSTVANRDLHKIVVDNGIFSGYVFLHGVPHIGLGWQLPPTEPNYSKFLNKSYRTTDGGLVPTGVLASKSTHANITLGSEAALAHYENTANVVADVTLHDDGIGLVAFGPIRPDMTETEQNELRGSELSGDWRSDVRGRLRLRIGLLVNVGGFPSDEDTAKQNASHFSAGSKKSLIGIFGKANTAEVPETTDDGALTGRVAIIERKLSALTSLLN